MNNLDFYTPSHGIYEWNDVCFFLNNSVMSVSDRVYHLFMLISPSGSKILGNGSFSFKKGYFHVWINSK